MQLVETVAEVRRIRRARSGSWGLVPTMGFLHAGHVSGRSSGRGGRTITSASRSS